MQFYLPGKGGAGASTAERGHGWVEGLWVQPLPSALLVLQSPCLGSGYLTTGTPRSSGDPRATECPNIPSQGLARSFWHIHSKECPAEHSWKRHGAVPAVLLRLLAHIDPCCLQGDEPSGMDSAPHSGAQQLWVPWENQGNGVQRVPGSGLGLKAAPSVLPKTQHWTGPGGNSPCLNVYSEICLLNTDIQRALHHSCHFNVQ